MASPSDRWRFKPGDPVVDPAGNTGTVELSYPRHGDGKQFPIVRVESGPQERSAPVARAGRLVAGAGLRTPQREVHVHVLRPGVLRAWSSRLVPRLRQPGRSGARDASHRQRDVRQARRGAAVHAGTGDG
jgi:hypothetical protein